MKEKFRVTIDRRLCKGCGICINFCPKKNLSFKDGELVFEGECSGCMLCVKYCPDFGIAVEEVAK